MTTETEIPEAEIVTPEPSRELVHAPAPAVLAVTPSVPASELVARLNVIKDAMETAMVEGVDYGRIPGVDKPTLFKPGAEKLGVLFQLDVQPLNEKTWGPGDHLTVVSKATVYSAVTGQRLGFGEGICTTRERKYGKRNAGRVCPSCSVAAIIKGKAEYGGGWVCFKKKDGCGAKFADGDASIEGQQTGEIENPDLPDMWNTVDKMASKRARVDAVLAVTGASALFTQDAEDMAPEHPPHEPQQQPEAPPDPVVTRAQVKQITDAMVERSKDGVGSDALANALLAGVGAQSQDFADEAAAIAFINSNAGRVRVSSLAAVMTAIGEAK